MATKQSGLFSLKIFFGWLFVEFLQPDPVSLADRMPQRVQGENSSLHGDFEDVGHGPKVVHFEPLRVATKWCTLTGG